MAAVGGVIVVCQIGDYGRRGQALHVCPTVLLMGPFVRRTRKWSEYESSLRRDTWSIDRRRTFVTRETMAQRSSSALQIHSPAKRGVVRTEAAVENWQRLTLVQVNRNHMKRWKCRSLVIVGVDANQARAKLATRWKPLLLVL